MTARTSEEQLNIQVGSSEESQENSNKQWPCWQQPNTHTNCSFSILPTCSEPAFNWDMKDAGDHSSGSCPARCMSWVHRGREAQVREGWGWEALPIWDRHLQVLSSTWGVSIKFPVCAGHLFTDVSCKGTSDLYRKKNKVTIHCNLLVLSFAVSAKSFVTPLHTALQLAALLYHPFFFTFKIRFSTYWKGVPAVPCFLEIPEGNQASTGVTWLIE